MASPQTENGYLKIANELAEAFARVQLSGHEWRVLWVIIRRTYGWNKKEDWISGTQIAQDSGLNRVRVCEALQALSRRHIILHENRRTAIQKDYDLWQNVTENRNSVTENRNKKLRKTVHTKDNKDISTKDISRTKKVREAPPPGVRSFYQVTGKYPRKTLYERVSKAFESREFDVVFARQCFDEWNARGYNGASIKWLEDWYVKGEIKTWQDKGKTTKSVWA